MIYFCCSVAHDSICYTFMCKRENPFHLIDTVTIWCTAHYTFFQKVFWIVRLKFHGGQGTQLCTIVWKKSTRTVDRDNFKLKICLTCPCPCMIFLSRLFVFYFRFILIFSCMYVYFEQQQKHWICTFAFSASHSGEWWDEKGRKILLVAKAMAQPRKLRVSFLFSVHCNRVQCNYIQISYEIPMIQKEPYSPHHMCSDNTFYKHYQNWIFCELHVEFKIDWYMNGIFF